MAAKNKWLETQFATESRLRNEAAIVEEIHCMPGTRFSIRASISMWLKRSVK